MVCTLPFTNTEISLRSKWQVLSPGQCQRASDLHRLCWTAFNYALTSDDKIIFPLPPPTSAPKSLPYNLFICCCSAITEFSSMCTWLYLFYMFCSYLHVLSFMIILSHKPSCILTGDNECRYVSWPIDPRYFRQVRTVHESWLCNDQSWCCCLYCRGIPLMLCHQYR